MYKQLISKIADKRQFLTKIKIKIRIKGFHYFQYFRGNTSPLIGIDISSSFIKALVLTRSKDQFIIEDFALEPLSEGSIVDNNIQEWENVKLCLEALLSKLKTKRVFAAIAMTGACVTTRIISLDPLDSTDNEKEIIERVELEANRYIPYALEEVYFDFKVLKKSKQKMEVLLAVARTDAIDSRVQLLKNVGLKTTIVDVESFCVERVFPFIVNALPIDILNKNIALWDMGATTTHLHVFRDFKIVYTREQTFGGKLLFEEIQKRFEGSLQGTLKTLHEDNEQFLISFKESVVQQMQRAFQTFFSSNDETEIHYIFLGGGLAALSGLGLAHFVQNRLGINTYVADPFVKIQKSNDIDEKQLLAMGPRFLVCLGLALRNFDNE